MKEKRRSQARRAAFQHRSIIVTVLGLAAAGTIMVLGSLGLYPRACLIASSLLSLFTLFYAISPSVRSGQTTPGSKGKSRSQSYACRPTCHHRSGRRGLKVPVAGTMKRCDRRPLSQTLHPALSAQTQTDRRAEAAHGEKKNALAEPGRHTYNAGKIHTGKRCSRCQKREHDRPCGQCTHRPFDFGRRYPVRPVRASGRLRHPNILARPQRAWGSPADFDINVTSRGSSGRHVDGQAR